MAEGSTEFVVKGNSEGTFRAASANLPHCIVENSSEDWVEGEAAGGAVSQNGEGTAGTGFEVGSVHVFEDRASGLVICRSEDWPDEEAAGISVS